MHGDECLSEKWGARRMIITRLDIYLTRIPLRKPFNISVSSVGVQENVLVALETKNGIRGWGETQPAPGFSEDTAPGIASVIREYLGPAVLGLDACSLGLLLERLDQVLPGNLYAKAAILDAAFDAAARSYGVPINTLLGGMLRDEVPCAWVVGIEDLETTVREAERAVGEGFRTLKLKIGKDAKDDLNRIRAVRGAVGAEVKLRLDANQGYSLATAVRTLSRAAAYEIEAIEQPTVAWDLTALRRVQEATDVPVMADESVDSLTDLLRVAIERAASIVNIKPAKNGGLYRARQCLDLARSAGIEPSFSSNFASSIGVAAVGALALASSVLNYAVEFHLGPYMLVNDLVGEPIRVQGGVLTGKEILGDHCGIGRTPDGDLLGKHGTYQEALKWR